MRMRMSRRAQSGDAGPSEQAGAHLRVAGPRCSRAARTARGRNHLHQRRGRRQARGSGQRGHVYPEPVVACVGRHERGRPLAAAGDAHEAHAGGGLWAVLARLLDARQWRRGARVSLGVPPQSRHAPSTPRAPSRGSAARVGRRRWAAASQSGCWRCRSVRDSQATKCPSRHTSRYPLRAVPPTVRTRGPTCAERERREAPRKRAERADARSWPCPAAPPAPPRAATRQPRPQTACAAAVAAAPAAAHAPPAAPASTPAAEAATRPDPPSRRRASAAAAR